MKLAINLTLSLGMLALCLWLVWPNGRDREGIETAFEALAWSEFAPYLAAYIGLMIVSQLCRSLRWNYLLAPLGVKIAAGPLLAISSVGFMAILALPARLGEFVRPGLLRRRGISASAALGTVAVERIVDGLMISLFVFGAFLVRQRSPGAPGWMMPVGFLVLGVFVAAFLFIVFAMNKPDATVRFCIRISLLDRLAPRIARLIEAKLRDMIRGFAVLRDVGNLTRFCFWTVVYWSANGLTVLVIARAFQLDLSLIGAFAVMGIVGVGISLPNPPANVGLYQAAMLAGLALYLGPDAEKGMPLYASAYACAMTQYIFQVMWYVATGALGLASPWVSIHDLRTMRNAAEPANAPPDS